MDASAIQSEIQRFESVHPSIYELYKVIHQLPNDIADEIRAHVINIEDAFVNAQEFTFPRSLQTIHLGILGGTTSPKSTLVHRYLTGQYVVDHSPEGGRFKKKLDNYLILIRDEGGPPELQFSSWLDVLIFVAGNHADVLTCLTYATRLNNYRNLTEIPIVLIATEPGVYINEFKKIPHKLFELVELKSGSNVDTAFEKCVNLVTKRSLKIIKEGTVLKKSYKFKKWKKKQIQLTENMLSYNNKKTCKSIDLNKSNVKSVNEKNFIIHTISKTLEFECCSKSERDNWVNSIEAQIFNAIKGGQTNESFKRLQKLSSFCADCLGGNDLTWISLNFGVIICIGCSGVHRSLGSHVSKVRSGVLDSIQDYQLAIALKLNGNANANLIYEGLLQGQDSEDRADIEQFIRRKYCALEWVEWMGAGKPELIGLIRSEQFERFFTCVLRVERYLWGLWVGDLLGEVVRGRFLGGKLGWLCVCLWREELEEEKKKELKIKLLEEVEEEEVRFVLEIW